MSAIIWKKKRVKVAAIGLVLIMALGITVLLLVTRFTSRSFWETTIEESISSKVTIREVEASLWASPTVLTLRGLTLKPRNGSDAEIRIQQLDLEMSLWSLLRRQIKVDSIRVRGANIRTVWYEDGSHSIESLFTASKSSEGNRAFEHDELYGREGLNVFEQKDFVASLGKLIIEDSYIDLTVEKTGLQLTCDNVSATMDSMAIDSTNLAETDKVDLSLSGQIRMTSPEGAHFGSLDVKGNTVARLFNPVSGSVEPDVLGDFTLGRQSWLNTRIPVITEAWKELGVLTKLGIPISPLPEKATFGRSEAVNAHYHLGKLTVLQPLSVWVGDWELALIEQSWLQTETDQHQITAELLASRSSSKSFKSILDVSTSLLPEGFVGNPSRALFRDERLHLKMKSSGALSLPNIEVVGGVRDAIKSVKDAGKGLIEKGSKILSDRLFGEGEK